MTTEKTDTPRTDEQNFFQLGDGADNFGSGVSVDFARQLEVELADATKQRDDARECLREAVESFTPCGFPRISGAADREDWQRWRTAAGLEGGK